VLAADSGYPDNVYLTVNIEFNPGKAGIERAASLPEYYDAEGYPLEYTKDGACGPPEGSAAAYSSECEMTVLGSGGWAVWEFDPDWRIIDGPGDDFITFSNHNLLGNEPDSSWNELAHVYISGDGENWYISGAEDYIENTQPGTSNSDYSWANVTDVHGNNHSWANFRKEIAAEKLSASTGVYEKVLDGSGNSVMISRYFKPDDPYLGGDRFDLSDFVQAEPAGGLNGSSWPAGGKMRYLKLVDDPSILDGQDWNPDWMTGARIMSAMGVNVEPAF
jgi:hypothetical protein